ncbi:MAG: SDR family NAD(P)-dependent oxidoreductase [Gemmatimonadetes bacterium]|nr:SDR family NAD(P)-dependent oxidoreductase [Gemmatimonadota bacterium]
MEDKVCVVTGATGGFGGATARALASRGATVLLVARDAVRGGALREEIARATGNDRVRLVRADLSSQAEVRAAAAEIAAYPRVDVLVNNAAVYTRKRSETVDGIETQWAVNHLAPFLLTRLLMDRLRAAGAARVVNVSSEAHRGARIPWADMQMRQRYFGWGAYGVTKLANILFTRELARRETGIVAHALHPGVVATELLMRGFPPIRLFRRFLKTPEQGASTSIFLATSPEAARSTGKYWIDARPANPAPAALDDDAARRLWEWSEGVARVS